MISCEKLRTEKGPSLFDNHQTSYYSAKERARNYQFISTMGFFHFTYLLSRSRVRCSYMKTSKYPDMSSEPQIFLYLWDGVVVRSNVDDSTNIIIGKTKRIPGYRFSVRSTILLFATKFLGLRVSPKRRFRSYSITYTASWQVYIGADASLRDISSFGRYHLTRFLVLTSLNFLI
jgi:hypothetical protein